MQAFTDHYYATFDSNRANLVGLYQDQSLLTFEGQKFQGAQQVGAWHGLCERGGRGLHVGKGASQVFARSAGDITPHDRLAVPGPCPTPHPPTGPHPPPHLPLPQIVQKLASLPFQQCQHRISSLDAQPSVSGGVIVFATGQLLVRQRGSLPARRGFGGLLACGRSELRRRAAVSSRTHTSIPVALCRRRERATRSSSARRSIWRR